MVVRLDPPDAPPIDVEVREGADGAFRAAGEFGLSPIVEVEDYGSLPASQRRAVAALGARLSRAPDEGHALLGAALPTLLERSARDRRWPPLLLLALGLSWFARRRIGWTGRRTPLGLFILALALRAALGLWGPLHVNGQGALWITGALEPEQLALYGPGYPEIFGWVGFFARPDRAIFVANAAFSACAAPLTWWLARELRLRRAAALWIALVVALDPVAVRIAPSESYLALLPTLWLWAALEVTRALASDGTRRGRFAAMTGAALVAAQIARTHPVGWIPLALLPTVALAPAASPSRRLLRAAGVAGVLGAGVVLFDLEVVLSGLAHAETHGRAGSTGALGDAAATLLGLACAAWLLRRRARPAALAILGLMAMAAMVATAPIYGQSALWEASYRRLYLAPLLLAVGAFWPMAWHRPTVAAAAALVATAALVHGHELLTALGTRTAEQREYAFLAHAFEEQPAACEVAAVVRAGRRRLFLPVYALPRGRRRRSAIARDVSRAGDLDAIRSRCLLYVHGSLCQSPEGRPLCERVERGASLERLDGALFEPIPSYDDLVYDAPRVEVTLFRVGRPDEADTRPGARDPGS